MPLVSTPALNVTKDVTSVTGGTANVAGDVIIYTITVQNTGNVTLTGIMVTDQVEAYAATNATYVSGDAAPLGTLNVGETWIYTASYTVTQADIDNNGGGDGDIDNTATADSDQTPPDTDNETVPLVRIPALNVTKDVTSVTGGTANVAGDVIIYTISVQNTGNVALTGITVTDQVEAYAATNATYVSGDAAPLGTLNVGETWTYTASYTLTQADLDNNGGGDGDIDNVATGRLRPDPP